MACKGCEQRRKNLKKFAKTVLKRITPIQSSTDKTLTQGFVDRMNAKYRNNRT